MNRPTQHTREQVLAAATTVFFREGVGASTAKIASVAGVPNGTLFNFFPTKQALIDALYVSIKTDLADAFGALDEVQPLEHRMRQVWDRWLGWARMHRVEYSVASLLHRSGLASTDALAVGDAAMTGPVRVLEAARGAGLLVDLPLEYLGALTQHHIDQAVTSELDDRESGLAFDVLFNGITRPSQNQAVVRRRSEKNPKEHPA